MLVAVAVPDPAPNRPDVVAIVRVSVGVHAVETAGSVRKIEKDVTSPRYSLDDFIQFIFRQAYLCFQCTTTTNYFHHLWFWINYYQCRLWTDTLKKTRSAEVDSVFEKKEEKNNRKFCLFEFATTTTTNNFKWNNVYVFIVIHECRWC